MKLYQIAFSVIDVGLIDTNNVIRYFSNCNPRTPNKLEFIVTCLCKIIAA